MGTITHFIIELFQKMFGPPSPEQILEEEESQKESVLLALQRLDEEGEDEVQFSSLEEIHAKLRRLGRNMPIALIPERCVSLVKAGFIQKIGNERNTSYVINNHGLNHLGLPGRRR